LMAVQLNMSISFGCDATVLFGWSKNSIYQKSFCYLVQIKALQQRDH
jgi:hypothetical protein